MDLGLAVIQNAAASSIILTWSQFIPAEGRYLMYYQSFSAGVMNTTWPNYIVSTCAGPTSMSAVSSNIFANSDFSFKSAALIFQAVVNYAPGASLDSNGIFFTGSLSLLMNFLILLL